MPVAPFGIPAPAKSFVYSYKFVKMNTLIIDNKSYVVVPAKSYDALLKRAALKTKPEKTFSVEEARAHSKKLIKKWTTEK
jgi:hypothetical protein